MKKPYAMLQKSKYPVFSSNPDKSIHISTILEIIGITPYFLKIYYLMRLKGRSAWMEKAPALRKIAVVHMATNKFLRFSRLPDTLKKKVTGNGWVWMKTKPGTQDTAAKER